MKFERQSVGAPSVDLTPMLDVVFLLLIFFMVSARFDAAREVPIDLPKVQSAATAQPKERTVVQMRSDGSIVLGGELVAREALPERLGGAQRVVLSADEAVSHGAFMDVLTALRALPLEAVTVEVEAAP